ncbi:Dihydrolipoamide acetyltransferase [Minicystis rosea]|nr:Dihydrolipoamide acetyltransferase [Minicystis rosea]
MHRSFACLSFAVALTLATPALADNPPQAPTKIRDRADELFSEGAKAYVAGRYAEAEQKLEEAWAIKRTHDIAGNLGVVKNKLGKPVDAAQYLAWSLLHFPPTESRRARQGYADELEKTRAEVGALRIRVNVAGAEVTVNGKAMGKAPLETEAFVSPGQASVAAQLEGYVTVQQSVSVVKGDTRDVTLSLVPLAPEKRSIVPGVVLGSVAGVVLATGIGLFAAYKGKRGDAADLNEAIVKAGGTCVSGGAHYDARCSQLDSTAKGADTLHSASVGLLIGAGAAAAGTAIYFLLPSSKPARDRAAAVRLVPLASPTSGGMLFSGSF